MKKRDVVLYNLYTNKAMLFHSLSEVKRFLGKNNLGNINVVAEGNTSYLRIGESYTIFYAEDYNLDNLKYRLDKINSSTGVRGVQAKDLLTNKKYNFKSIRKAAEALNMNKTSVSRVLRGKLDQSKGYTFKYAHEITVPDSLPEVAEWTEKRN